MTHRLSPDQFHHPLEEIDHLEGYLANREYLNQWYQYYPHVTAERKRDEAERQLEGLEAGLPTVGPYL
jgi:4-hydroxyphenylpyruvate dioxygenase-like putative hemolysin